jgi:hypothetical protein
MKKEVKFLEHPSQLLKNKFGENLTFDEDKLNLFLKEFNLDKEYFNKFLAMGADLTKEIAHAVFVKFNISELILFDVQEKFNYDLEQLRMSNDNLFLALINSAWGPIPNEKSEIEYKSLVRIISKGGRGWGNYTIFELVNTPGIFYRTGYLESNKFIGNTEDNLKILEIVKLENEKVRQAEETLNEIKKQRDKIYYQLEFIDLQDY